MADNIQIPANLGSFLSDPQRIRDAIELLNALANLNVQLVSVQGTMSLAPAQKNIVGNPPNLVLPLPLMFSTSIADPSATAASCQTAIKELFTELRKTKMLPT